MLTAGESLSFVSFFATDVTDSLSNCSMLRSARWPGCFPPALSAAPAVVASSSPSAVRKALTAVAAARDWRGEPGR